MIELHCYPKPESKGTGALRGKLLLAVNWNPTCPKTPWLPLSALSLGKISPGSRWAVPTGAEETLTFSEAPGLAGPLSSMASDRIRRGGALGDKGTVEQVTKSLPASCRRLNCCLTRGGQMEATMAPSSSPSHGCVPCIPLDESRGRADESEESPATCLPL